MLIQFEFWHWWVLALCFVVIEAMVPVGVLASMGVAAGIVGGLVMAYPFLELRSQLGIFGAFTMVAIVFFARYKRKKFLEEMEKGETPAQRMIGKEFELTRPIQNGFGEVELDGQHWPLKGPPLSAGTLVKVVRLDGDMLLVFPADLVNKDIADAKKNQNDASGEV
ncbi:MAG TPA: NfeD family protein [Gammaproteobacteria bacterium]|nr:NfeD family protein [Gammaproteobacteria bacterium]